MKVGEVLQVPAGIRTVLVKHRENRTVIGIGYYLEGMERDRARSVEWPSVVGPLTRMLERKISGVI